MKLFVFNVSPAWDYCGGASVVIAESFDQAVDLLLAYKDDDASETLEDHRFYEKLEDIPDLEKHYYAHDPKNFFYSKTCGWDEWVLVGCFDVKETDPKVVLVSYNYA